MFTVIWHSCWGDVNKCLLTPDRELTTEQSKKPPNSWSNVMNQWVFGGSFRRILVTAYFQEQNWLRDSCVTRAYSSMSNSLQTLRSRAHCAACRQLNRLEGVLPDRSYTRASPRRLSRPLLLSSFLATLTLFWAAHLVEKCPSATIITYMCLGVEA